MIAKAALSDVARIIQGGRHRLSGNDFVPAGCPAYGAGGMNGFLSTYEFDEPAIVLSAIGARCGKCFLTSGKWSSLANTQVILPDPQKADVRYLWYQLNDEGSWLRSGTAQPFIKPSTVKSREVWLPPVSEQRRIADILDKADAVRRKRKEAIALTEELLRSAFLEMFGDPVTNPKGWPVKLLGDTTELFAGNSLPSGEPFEGQPNGFLLLKVGDMNLPGNEVHVAAAREWAGSASGGVVAPVGSVIFPKRGGAIATNKKRVLLRPAALDPNLMAVAPAGSLSLPFLRQWFEMFDLASLSSGSAVPQLNKKDLSPLPIPVPPETAQASFAAVTARVAELRRRAERALVLAEDLFSGLAQRAFRGELRRA